MIVYLLIARRLGAFEHLMRLSAENEAVLPRSGVGITLAFIYIPLLVIPDLRLNSSEHPQQ